MTTYDEEIFSGVCKLLEALVQRHLSDADFETLCEWTTSHKMDELETAVLDLQLLAGDTTVASLELIWLTRSTSRWQP